MAQLTNTALFTEIKANFEANTHAVTTNDVNATEGVTTPSTATINIVLAEYPELEQFAQAIADAIITKIKSDGIDIGPSLADTLDVG
jgi:16S rRNA C1402 N4-methylase RsmH